ncbi:MAG: type II toxin-antitoxin system ParD family antitoxin [bacterium]|nr:type II toxin-antitoxin system ParD family antitoxin [bacterium]
MPRVIVSISLPRELNLEIEKKVKSGRYASKSEYFRDLVRKNLLKEELLLKREKKAVAEGLKDIKEGRVSKAFTNSREAMKYLSRL